ncbi:MAG: hypothetical protein JXA87_03520 [Thermoleophilia bacterium]|nr:hypothetical protein [Thermoleophilia bacterium]
MATLYRDRWIECTTESVIIRGYYFPFGTKKTIPYHRIQGMREVAMGPLTGQGRIWGSGDLRHYTNLDPGRPHKKRALILDLGRFIRPVITPDDTDQVKAIVSARMAGRSCLSDVSSA